MSIIVTQEKNGRFHYHSDQTFKLTNDLCLPEIDLVYETYGQLNEARDNAILIIHALSTHAHVRSHDKDPTPGWWEKMIGPGCHIDTNQFFVVCINNLGSCFGSTGPTSFNPNTKQPYCSDFPKINMLDIANSQRLIQDYLNIPAWHTIVSPSMGAMIGLEWAVNMPDAVKNLISISSGYKSYASNIAIRSIVCSIIRLDPAYQNGFYDSHHTLNGFTIARMLGHLVYRHPDAINAKFDGLLPEAPGKGNIIEYLNYNANKFTSTFDANSFLYLTEAMNHFNIGDGYDDAVTAARQITGNVHVISVSSDSLFPPSHQNDLVSILRQAGVNTSYDFYESNYGHDAFLVEIDGVGSLIERFIN